METLQVRSTSKHSAVCSDIVIRDGDNVRLVFRPEIVNNPQNPRACIRGRFLYQRKGKKDIWQEFDSLPLSSLKKGEQFRLELKAGELLPLLRDLGALYRVHRAQGVPQGYVEFVKLERELAKLLQLNEAQLNAFLSENDVDAITILRRVLSWLSKNPDAATHFSRDEGGLPELNALVGLANLRSVLTVWQQNSGSADESFWQELFGVHSYVLSHIFAYPVVMIRGKAYVGGKRIDNAHGNLVDFLGQVKTSGEAVLIEIKTPASNLLGTLYRQDVYPPSQEVVGAVSQVLKYRESLLSELNALNQGEQVQLSGVDPRCVVIVGNADRDLYDDSRRRSFERFRERFAGVTIVTFDELFGRVGSLIRLLEGVSGGF